MPDDKLAEEVYSKAPWWASAPIALTAGIVGVPSLIAIMAGVFIAKNVTAALKDLGASGQSEIALLREHMTTTQKTDEAILRFIEADLRVQYRTCIAASKTDAAKEACITAAEREKELDLNPDKDGE